MVAVGVARLSLFFYPSFRLMGLLHRLGQPYPHPSLQRLPTPQGLRRHGGGEGRTDAVSNPMDGLLGPGLVPTRPSPSLLTLSQVNAQGRSPTGWAFWNGGWSGLRVWRWGPKGPPRARQGAFGKYYRRIKPLLVCFCPTSFPIR